MLNLLVGFTRKSLIGGSKTAGDLTGGLMGTSKSSEEMVCVGLIPRLSRE